jgi:hypothetical protein
MFLVTLLTRQHFHNDHPDNLTKFIDLATTRTIRETTRTNDVAKIVALATTRSKWSKRFCSRQQSCEAWRECACNCAYEQCCDVARVIALATTSVVVICPIMGHISMTCPCPWD